MPIALHPSFRLEDKPLSKSDLLLWAADQLHSGRYTEKVAAFVLEWFSDSPFCTAFSSGTTGKAKEIRLSKKAMWHSSQATAQYLQLKAGSTALCALPSDYISGKMMLVRAISLGWNLYLAEPQRNPFAHNNKEYDFAALTPMQAECSLGELHKVRKLILGGSSISPELEAQLLQLPTKVWSSYGMTETLSHIALRPVGTNVYQCVLGVKISTDHRNCLIINAPQLATEPIQTNDVVELLNDKEFRWIGRHDHIINSGGIKINPETIEQKLSGILTTPFFIDKMPDSLLGEKVILVVEGKNNTATALQQRIAQLKELSKYEIPKEIIFKEHFCYTPTGKIQRELTLQLPQ